MRVLAFVCALLVAVPSLAAAQAPCATPDCDASGDVASPALIVAGAAGGGLIAVGWVMNVLTSMLADPALLSGDDVTHYRGVSWIPWVGPWVNAAMVPEGSGMFAFNVTWGVFQGAGLVVALVGTLVDALAP